MKGFAGGAMGEDSVLRLPPREGRVADWASAGSAAFGAGGASGCGSSGPLRPQAPRPSANADITANAIAVLRASSFNFHLNAHSYNRLHPGWRHRTGIRLTLPACGILPRYAGGIQFFNRESQPSACNFTLAGAVPP